MTPVLVRDEAMFGTGQLPKFTEDSYQTTNGWWLIPTSEVTQPTRLQAMCWKRPICHPHDSAYPMFPLRGGSAGRDTAGMLRQHQFEKVEMVSITHPDHSRAELTV